MGRSWQFLDPNTCNPKVFGLRKINAVKVKKYTGIADVRNIKLRGQWSLYADQLEHDPVTGKKLIDNEWFIFAANGEEL